MTCVIDFTPKFDYTEKKFMNQSIGEKNVVLKTCSLPIPYPNLISDPKLKRI